MLALALTLVLGGGPAIRTTGPGRAIVPSIAQPRVLLQFAPSSGAGMGVACAGTTPTGSNGETLTFTRATAATCLKGNLSAGIANGDLVKLTTGQPRVMSGGSGPLGILVEPARTNSTLRSEEFDNAAWIKGAIGVAVPTVTANAAVAPDGTSTADRVQFPATTLGQLTDLNQTACATSSTDSATIFVTANQPGAGSLSLCMCAGAACNGPVDFTCSTCNFTPTGWSRCSLPNVAMGALGIVFFGNVDAAPAADVFIWGAQCETGAYASSYIPTTSAAVTRNADVASVAVTLPASPPTLSTSVTGVTLDGLALLSGNDLIDLKVNATNRTEIAFVSNTKAVYTVAGTGHTVTKAGPPASGTSVATYSDGTNIAICTNGSCTTTAGAYTLATGAASLFLGGFESTGFEAGAIVKQVCVDSSPTRCR